MESSTDTHTLLIKCDCANELQIRQSLRDAIHEYMQTTGTQIDCCFRVNLPNNAEGKRYGIAFAFLTNPAVYHMLLRRNPDGSDRVEYIDDPAWTPPPEGELVNESGWSGIANAIPVETTNSWYDQIDENEQEVQQFTCPKIPIILEPLMKLAPIRLTEEQRETKRMKIINENQGKPGFDDSMVSIPEFANLSVEPAVISNLEPKFMSNILKAKDVPTWITRDILKAEFAPYASDSATRHVRFIKGSKIEEAYPFVNVNTDRVAFIIFDPSTHDAQFALHMTKKLTISRKAVDGSVASATLIFGHSFRTDRDTMADISQQPRPFRRRDGSYRRPRH